MAFAPDGVDDLLRGPLRTAGPWPLVLQVAVGELRPAFLPKGKAGRGYRAVSRNGRVLFASDHPLEALLGRTARLRVQTWHRVILPGMSPEAFGVLVSVRCTGNTPPEYSLAVEPPDATSGDLGIDVGGRRLLVLRLMAPDRAPGPAAARQ